jgi:hypothetical protein
MPTTDVRDVLRELSVPQEAPEFFDELRERMREHDRTHARRWRRASVAAAAVAVLAITAAAVFAATRGSGSTVDRTASCATTNGAVQLTANAELPNPKVASAGLWTENSLTTLFAVDTRYSGFTLNGSRCRAAAARIPRARSSLPSAGTYDAGDFRGLTAYCPAARRVVVHFRVHLDSAGKPLDAKIAVWGRTRRAKPLRPLAFLQWSPQGVVTYLSSRCTTQ